MTKLSFFLYRSETALAPDSDSARDLSARAARTNADLGLTGFLHHENGFFFQWIEGPPGPLDRIVTRLWRDPRHSNLMPLSGGGQTSRAFRGWDMGYATRSNRSILAWLADHGVAPHDRRGHAACVLSFLLERSAAIRG